MKYIVVEIQTNNDGAVGNLVNSYDNRDEAESKFHLVLQAAAVSTLPVHAAVLMTNEGSVMETRAYYHTQPGGDDA